MAHDPEFMQQVEYVWKQVDNDTTWNLIFARMLQLMDRDELKAMMRKAYSEYTAEAGLGEFKDSKYALGADDE